MPVKKRVDDGVNQAISIGLLCIDELAAGNQLLGSGDTNQTAGTLSATQTWVDANTGFRKCEH